MISGLWLVSMWLGLTAGQPAESVEIPLADYEKLEQKLETMKKDLAAAEKNRIEPVVQYPAELVMTVSGQFVHCQLQIKVDKRTADWSEIPLAPAATIKSSKITPPTGRLVIKDDLIHLVTDKAGNYTCLIETVLSLAELGTTGRVGFDLRTPAIPLRQCQLALSSKYLDLTVDQGRILDSKEAKETTTSSLVLPPSAKVHFSFLVELEKKVDEKVAFSTEESTINVLLEQGISAKTQCTIQMNSGKIRDLSLWLPPEVTLLAVRGKDVEKWFQAGQQVNLSLTREIKDRTTFVIHTRLDLAAIAKIDLVIPTIQNATGQVRTIGLKVPPFYRVALEESGSWADIDPSGINSIFQEYGMPEEAFKLNGTDPAPPRFQVSRKFDFERDKLAITTGRVIHYLNQFGDCLLLIELNCLAPRLAECEIELPHGFRLKEVYLDGHRSVLLPGKGENRFLIQIPPTLEPVKVQLSAETTLDLSGRESTEFSFPGFQYPVGKLEAAGIYSPELEVKVEKNKTISLISDPQNLVWSITPPEDATTADKLPAEESDALTMIRNRNLMPDKGEAEAAQTITLNGICRYRFQTINMAQPHPPVRFSCQVNPEKGGWF